MRVNYRYVLDQCRVLCAGGKILDYGCGGGDVVQAGLKEGLNISGVEAFYGGSRAKEIAADRGLLGVSIFPLAENYSIPFSDQTFDLVVSNQVLEHVEDLNFTLNEIYRVLKPNGKLLALFPSAEVIREGHCGIPFAHWFSEDSIFRYPYIRILRGLGLGNFTTGKSCRQWTLDFMEWLDKYTVYRSYPDIKQSFRKADMKIKHQEADYINYRLRYKRIFLPDCIVSSRLWRAFSSKFCRLFGGMIILATKNS